MVHRLGITAFTCPECQAEYWWKDTFAMHLITEHGMSEEEAKKMANLPEWWKRPIKRS